MSKAPKGKVLVDAEVLQHLQCSLTALVMRAGGMVEISEAEYYATEGDRLDVQFTPEGLVFKLEGKQAQ